MDCDKTQLERIRQRELQKEIDKLEQLFLENLPIGDDVQMISDYFCHLRSNHDTHQPVFKIDGMPGGDQAGSLYIQTPVPPSPQTKHNTRSKPKIGISIKRIPVSGEGGDPFAN
jgi:hypothetical protein